MKIGLQTIIMGNEIYDIENLFRSVSDLGFSGVEIAQDLDRIYFKNGRKASLKDIFLMSDDYGVSIAGICSGDLLDRLDKCIECGRFPDYMYIDRVFSGSDGDIGKLFSVFEERSSFIALHQHVYKNCDRFSVIVDQFKKYPKLKWIPDTAHLFIAGDDPIESIQLHYDKIVSIHLKDWTQAYGRSFHRYAKGFTCLGDGDCPVKEVLDLVISNKYKEWIIIEQDYVNFGTVTECISKSMFWLSDQMHEKRSDILEKEKICALNDLFEDVNDIHSRNTASKKEFELINLIYSNVRMPLSDFYSLIAKAICTLFKSEVVALWSCHPNRNDLCLLASYAKRRHIDGIIDGLPKVLSKVKYLDTIGYTIDSMKLWNSIVGSSEYSLHPWEDILRDGNSDNVYYIPVHNLYNMNQMRLVIAVYSNVKIDDQLVKTEKNSFLYHVTNAIDLCLECQCSYRSNLVNSEADKSVDIDDFIFRLRGILIKSINCMGSSLFLVNRTGDRLEYYGDEKNIYWNSKFKFYGPNLKNRKRGFTLDAWVAKRPLVIAHAQIPEFNGGFKPYVPTSTEIGDGINKHIDNVLIVPIISISQDSKVNTPSVIGVVRCRNKKCRKSDNIQKKEDFIYCPIFTDDDAAIVDVILHSSAPKIELMMADNERRKSVGRIIHEIKHPIAALSKNIDLLAFQVTNGLNPMDYVYFKDIEGWFEYFMCVFKNAHFYGVNELRRIHNLNTEYKKSLIWRDVLSSISIWTKPSIEDRGFNQADLNCNLEDFYQIPEIWIDVNLIRIAIFNVISNAIKYSYNDKNRFNIILTASVDENFYKIHCRDKGPGIHEDYREMIFEEGIRGPDEVNQYVRDGLGLGLWVVRKIMEAHDGHVAVTNLYQPTELTLFFPKKLRYNAPSKK
ncbi:ATP-binding protein [Armatimonas rosea]|uniref:histidine kinase n=1 Tax=Armatimonas rosea TaxID=685828 RepID=A0A7W9SLJ9_ARMRO|nr:ATP-binding protein [Armatimonas rosea]MBB6048860.1 sugar phosphate isomerase/epimerase [Armatimonas rosea]